MYCSREVLLSRERVSYKENAVKHGDGNTNHIVERLPFIRAGDPMMMNVQSQNAQL